VGHSLIFYVTQIAEMYEKQALATGGKKKKGGAEDDGFW
jgi:hypothetical protein